MIKINIVVKILITIVLFYFLFSFFGCERNVITSTENDNIPPAVPQSLEFFQSSDGKNILQWLSNNEADLDGYNVYRSINNSIFKKTAFTQNNFFIDDSLFYDSLYSYKITAVDIWNNESNFSNTVSSKPVNKNPPEPPENLFINARNWLGHKSIFISWHRNRESDINFYKVYRSETNDFQPTDYNFIGRATKNEFSDTTVSTVYKNYFYLVTAEDKGGLISLPSEIVFDQIYEMTKTIFPSKDTTTNFFDNFIIEAIKIPSRYKIIVQTNQFFGEFWSKDFFSNKTNDTLHIRFDPLFVEPNKSYYWRVLTFSANNTEPNSINELWRFVLVP